MAELKITAENFEAEVMKSEIPVLIDFWASWCGPCRMIAPLIEEIAKDKEGQVKVCKVNVDEEPELANAFNVSSIPMVVAMKNGKVTKGLIGYQPKAKILSLLDE